jgi:1-deoxy-D-xylulose-5-phosphate reductoisomerase
MKKRISILGATGSIGQSTTSLLTDNRDEFQVVALTANRNVKGLAKLARDFQAEFVAIGDESLYESLKDLLSDCDVEIAAGEQGLVEAARRQADLVISAIMGAAGLKPTLAAIEQGQQVGLANKESLVCAGPLMMEEVAKNKATLIPLDSEHSAIFQALKSGQGSEVDSITLTASGGPFRTTAIESFSAITPQEATTHPNWDMGAKISVDSATLANKGLELIEAAYLFDLPEEKIDIVVHQESIIHGMVTFKDGSSIAQMGCPDMRTPISYALQYPDRIETSVDRLNLAKLGVLHFEEPDLERFPALRIAREALKTGQNAPLIFNAANEVVVKAFLDHQLKFIEIPVLIEKVLEKCQFLDMNSVENVLNSDAEARIITETLIKQNLKRAS